jgi:hypothetical protein
MGKVKVKAIFKGLENSCGYRTDREYTLIISHKTNKFIQIEDINGGGRCNYGSMISLLQNWDNVRNV